MADISNEIKNFREAIYGREVRGSMISLAEKMNGVSEITERAEEKRVSAETNRVNAEKKRQTDTEEAIRNSTAATNRAEEAAERAEGLVIGDISEKTVTFVQAAERSGIQSGDSLAIAFGKLAKYCADLKPHAFEEPVQNLITTVAGKALDATMGKQINDDLSAKVRELNSALDLYHGYSNLIPNALSISDLRTGYVQASAGSTGLPEGVSTGTRHVYKISSRNIVVEIREHSPNVGRIWRRRYDGENWATSWTQV